VIKINWQDVSNKDFLTYRVYRSTTNDSGYEAIGDTKSTGFVDKIDEDGKEYFYRVSVIDRDKLESMNKNSSALGRTLVKPAAPVLSEARYFDGRVKLSWSKTDDRTISYIVQKEYKKGFFETKIEDFENINSTEFSDTNLVAGGTYYYRVFSVDINKIKSNPSTEALIKIENGAPADKPAAIKPSLAPQKTIQDSAPVAPPATEVVQESEVNVIVPVKDF
jgi:fibronectin type 3 domain-containing protein